MGGGSSEENESEYLNTIFQYRDRSATFGQHQSIITLLLASCCSTFKVVCHSSCKIVETLHFNDELLLTYGTPAGPFRPPCHCQLRAII